jgi:hypothetical protein
VIVSGFAPCQPLIRPVLYKYLKPERRVDLTQCLIRFSQRQVFEDKFELKPEVTTFGSESEIMAFFASDPALATYPRALSWLVAKHVLDTPGKEAALIELAQSQIKAADEFAVLCLSEDPACDRMWQDYADNGRGFVVAFDTTCTAFDSLRTPGRIGKVEYSDEPIASFLSAYGANTFFRKRTRYKFEAEWRSIRPSIDFLKSDDRKALCRSISRPSIPPAFPGF